VHLDAFAICEIEDHCGLSVPPFEKVIVHYVLKGEGTIESEHGSLPINAGMAVVIPKGLAKQINARGPIKHVVRAEVSCPLAPGLVKFHVPGGADGCLVLGCASVHAEVGQNTGLFDNLLRPLAYDCDDPAVASIFQSIFCELQRPGIGTKALVDTMMKQALILLFRQGVRVGSSVQSLYHPLLDFRLVQTLSAIDTHPGEAHTLTMLARRAGMSRSRFSQRFAETFGTTPMSYVKSARLMAAARSLRSSALPVKSIAIAVGYASRSQFSRAFTAMFGADPTTFRHGSSGEETPTPAPDDNSDDASIGER
jgi:AraC-like DNA-binding protein